MAPPSTRAAEVANNATAEDTEAARDCAVCFLPLKAPPIFECDAGHVICSSCGDKMAPAGRCRVCRPSHGCDVWPAYHDRHARFRRVPRRCPAEACLFAGSMEALVGHFAAAHPCTTGVSAGEAFDVHLQDGVNIFAVDRDDGQYAAVDSSRYLLVLNGGREPFGRTVSAFFVRASTAAEEPSPFWAPSKQAVQCQLGLTYSRYTRNRRGDLVRSYYQRTDVDVACTDLADGLPDPDDWFQTTVHKSDDDVEEGTVEVTVRVTIQ